MPGSSTRSFTGPDAYQASVADIFAEFTLLRPGTFAARADRTELRHMHFLHARESLPRVAYVALPADLAFISFSSDPRMPLVWRGITLAPNEIMLHARGERLHQRTDGPSCWGLVALSPASLAAYSHTETGGVLSLPLVGRIICPPPRDLKWLLRVHRQAARLAETRPAIIGNPAVVLAMEQELVGPLIRCLTEGDIRAASEAELHAADVMQRFESALAQSPQRSPTAAELTALLGVSFRTLQEHCAAFLGVSPRRYMQLRQLTRARAAIRRADPHTAKIGELAQAAGFSKSRHFRALYKATYGETPVATLRRAGGA